MNIKSKILDNIDLKALIDRLEDYKNFTKTNGQINSIANEKAQHIVFRLTNEILNRYNYLLKENNKEYKELKKLEPVK